MAYPTDLDSFTTRDGEQIVASAHINALQVAVVAIETILGTLPAGTAADVKTRLARALDGVGNLDFATSGGLTISSGSITPTQNWHTVDTESSAAADNLDTILATNCTDGFILYLRQYNSARYVTIKHNTGNIACPGGVDIVITDTTQVVTLIYDATLTKWLAAVTPANAGLINKINTWSAMNTFSKAVNYAYTSLSANTTLDTTHSVVDVDASGAAITITLPTAVGCNGREYRIRKLDSSANAVTIDGAGAETINGAATKLLSAQYATATLLSNGTNWIVL